jgi:hypothetical protein
MTFGQFNFLAIAYYRYKVHYGTDDIGLKVGDWIELVIFEIMWLLAIASHLRSMITNPGTTKKDKLEYEKTELNEIDITLIGYMDVPDDSSEHMTDPKNSSPS